MSAAAEVKRLREEVIPLLAMTSYTLGRLAELGDENTEVDSFQLEMEAMLWWHRIEAKSRDLDS